MVLEHVLSGHALADWSWDRGVWREALHSLIDRAPGPGELCGSSWANAPSDWTSYVGDLVEALAAGAEPLERFLNSIMAFTLEGGHVDDNRRIDDD